MIGMDFWFLIPPTLIYFAGVMAELEMAKPKGQITGIILKTQLDDSWIKHVLLVNIKKNLLL